MALFFARVSPEWDRVPPVLQVTPLAARRFHRRALLLDAPVPDIGTALAHHGYVQIDPINVCGRMHDHILRHRVLGYREGDLMRHLHGEAAPLPAAARTAFEHHLPDTHVLVAFPLDAWPHLLAAMHQRTRAHGAWSGKLTPRERDLTSHILGELAARGPLSSDDIEDAGRRARRVWGTATFAKSTLQKLFFHGHVLIACREKNRRLYHLPERVLTPDILRRPEPSAADTVRWSVQLKLRQRRLVLLKRAELAAVADLVQPVAVGSGPTLYCLASDVPVLHAASDDSKSENPISKISPPLLLAPLDPLIYDRRVTRTLWNFDYTWEAYTPASKRVRGHYALPILAGHELVGHVDPKADRERGQLVVVSRRVRRGHRVAPAVHELARFLGLR